MTFRETNIDEENKTKLITRFTTLWGFSEAALGGLLHLIKFPFRGMFIGANAVILISLISFFSEKKKDIIKATLMVMLVKAIISPYTPLTAYFAVAFQGFTGYGLYRFLNIHKLSAILHSILAQLQSSLQKFIGLTLFFGMTFWESFDTYINYTISKLGIWENNQPEVSYSLVIVSIYVFIHLIAGVYAGIVASRTPGKIIDKMRQAEVSKLSILKVIKSENNSEKRKKKYWWQKKSGIVILSIFIIMIILPFIDPALEKENILNVVYMITRAVLLTVLWFYFLSPLIVKFLKKYLKRKESVYVTELNEMLAVIPFMKELVKEEWENRRSGIKGVGKFVSNAFYELLIFEGEKLTSMDDKVKDK